MVQIKEHNERTKCALADALIRIMDTKPFESITIKELTDMCHIKRQSFYYHFRDIYELLEWIIKRDRDIFEQKKDEYLCWQDYVLALLKLMEKDRKKYINISNALGWRYIYRFYQKDLHTLLEQTIFEYPQGNGLSKYEPQHMKFLVDYYSFALSAVLESWIHGELCYSPEELVANFDTIIQDEARGAMIRNSYALKDHTCFG